MTRIGVALRPRLVLEVQLALIACLTLASLAGQVSTHWLGRPYVYGLVRLFDLDREANVPTVYSAAALLACALVLALIAHGKRAAGDEFARHWQFLAVAFAALALDELVSFHDSVVSEVAIRAFGGRPGGVFHFPWVIAGLLLVGALAATYVRFVRALPAATRRLVVLAAALYVGGALGVELAGGAWVSAHGSREGMAYALITTVEEVLEMLGVAVFLQALLRAASESSPFQLSLECR